MKKTLAILMLVAAVSGCSDTPTAPPEPTSIQILEGDTPLTVQTIEVAETVQLTAAVQMSRGPSDPAGVSWRSTIPSVATVSGNGLVTGVSEGESLIIASAGQVADTARIIVTQPPATEVTCGPTNPVLNLQVGEVHQARARDTSLLCLSGGAGGAEYAIVPFHASASASALQVEMLGGDIRSPALPLYPSIARTRPESPILRAPQGAENWEFHLRMREMERTLLRTRRTPASGPQLSTAQASVPSVDQIIQLNAEAEACTGAAFRPARVEAVSTRAIVVADTTNPAGGFTRADYQQFAAEFDSFVWPVLTQNFGTPSDVDQNQRVIIFFTKAVNDMTTPGSGSYVGGFYHPRDLFPRTGTGSCAGSNVGEVLYQLVPDPARADTHNETFLRTAEVKRRTMAVVAHELQHLVNASIRILELDAPLEDLWLNEGLSHIAEELVFYREAGLGAEQNITLETLRSSQKTLDAVNRHQISNLGRFISFLESPHQLNLGDGNEIVTRGGSWAFLRYAADRKATPAEQQQLWTSLVRSHDVGIANINRVFGITAFDWLQDWSVSLLADDSGLPVAPQYLQPSWNFRSVLPALMQDESFPLHTRTLANNQMLQFTLRAGGSSFVRLGVASGSTGGVRVTSGRATPPESLRLSIIRTR